MCGLAQRKLSWFTSAGDLEGTRAFRNAIIGSYALVWEVDGGARRASVSAPNSTR